MTDWTKLTVWLGLMAFCVLVWCGVIYIIWKILT
jgi:hypothetical protein